MGTRQVARSAQRGDILQNQGPATLTLVLFVLWDGMAFWPAYRIKMKRAETALQESGLTRLASKLKLCAKSVLQAADLIFKNEKHLVLDAKQVVFLQDLACMRRNARCAQKDMRRARETKQDVTCVYLANTQMAVERLFV